MELVTQHFIMAKDLNAYGNLFGGKVLAWLDEAGAVFVIQKINYTNIVTVAMDEVTFRNAAHLGDIIQIYAEIIHTGKSSITVRVEAKTNYTELHKDSSSFLVIIDCKITYVCLGENGRPFPFFVKA